MSFVEAYIRRPYLVSSLILLVVAFGVVSFREMPLNLFPDANYPSVVVLVYQPGASAEDMEDKVARPIELELGTIDLVRKITSVSNDEMAVVKVEFEYEKGLDAAATDVANALQRIAWKLPSGAFPPQIFKVSDATVPVATIAVYPREGSGLTMAEVRQIAENEIKKDLLRIPHVADVEVFGGFRPEIRVLVDRVALSRSGLSILDVFRALSSQNRNVPAGFMTSKSGEYLFKLEGEKRAIGEIKGVVVGRDASGSPVFLGDVARVELTHERRRSLFHGNGKRAIAINVLRSPKGHVTTTLRWLERELPRIKKKYPQLAFEIVDTQKKLINTSISNMMDSLRDAIVMTVVVILFFLGSLRMSLLAAFSIPIVYFMTFAEMRLLGYELNIVTLTAIILSVGLLLDDAIVVIENIDRHIRELKKPPFKAAVDGTREIILADFAGTYTTVIVLVPIMFIGGYVQKILRPLTTVLALSLINSFFISVTVIPLLASRFMREGEGRIDALLGKLQRLMVEPPRRFYLSLLDVALRRRLLFIAAAVALLLISKKVMPLAGRDLMPPMDTGILKVKFQVESGYSVNRTEEVLEEMERIIKRQKGLLMFDAVVGSEPGVVSFASGLTPQTGLITVHFVDRFHRKETLWDIEERLRRAFRRIPGLKYVDVYDFGATPLSSIAAPVDIMVSGPDPKVLNAVAYEVKRRLEGVKGLTSVSRSWDMDRLEHAFVVDPERAGKYGLSVEDVSRQVALSLEGGVASIFRVDGEEGYPVRVMYPEEHTATPKKMGDALVSTPLGDVPLLHLASFLPRVVQTSITHQNYERTVDIYGYRATMAITHLQAGIDRALSGLRVPDGYSITKEGEFKKMKESFSRLVRALALAVLLLYFSLVPTFRSWVHPFTIMAAIPLALVGAVWGLLITGRHACMPAFMGMILLAGVVVNNSILLIDFAQRAIAEGASLREALEGAVRVRVRPILMTASSTVVGMIPVAAQWAVGLERLSPLAVVAIGGLVVSTLLTLVYVPVLYSLLRR